MTAPVVTNVVPAEGPPGTLITIEGTDLAQVTAVLINGSPAKIQSQNDTLIGFIAPVAMVGMLNLELDYPGKAVLSNAFDETPPPPSFNPLLVGCLDRGGLASGAYAPVMGGGVINGKEQGEVGLDELFPTSDMKLAAINAVDTWIAAAEALEKVIGKPVGGVLRPAAGFHVPSYILSADGPPVMVTDPVSGHAGPVSRGFWKAGSKFWQWFEECHTIMAAKWNLDPHIRVVEMGRNTTAYNEWCVKQIADKPSVANLRAAGYTTAADQAAFAQDFAFFPRVWTKPRIGSSFNPFQEILPTVVEVAPGITSNMIRLFVSALGAQASVENCSLSQTRPSDPTYAPLYTSDLPAAKAAGASVRIQTATAAKVGNLFAVAEYAAQTCKATSVEFPEGYEAMLSVAQVAQLSAMLAANA